MGRKAGLDPALMRQALLGGSARSFVLESHAKRMLEGTFRPGFRAELMRKDMRLALGAVRDHGVFAPATALAAQMMEAVVNAGRGGQDAASLYAVVAELSGLKTEAWRGGGGAAARLHQLYYGTGEDGRRFRYAVLAFDLATVVFVITSSFLPRHPAIGAST